MFCGNVSLICLEMKHLRLIRVPNTALVGEKEHVFSLRQAKMNIRPSRYLSIKE